MKWLKLNDTCMIDMDKVSYVSILRNVVIVDGKLADFNPEIIAKVWAALQEPNTVVPESAHRCVKCGRMFDQIETVRNTVGGLACVTCPSV